MRTRNWLIASMAMTTALAMSACGPTEGGAEAGQDPAAQQSGAEGAGAGGAAAEGEQPGAGEAPTPDVADIPDVVAEVDGEEIGKDEFVPLYESQFQQMAMQAQSTGQQLDQQQLKEQTAESLVSGELLGQEAEERDLTASEEDVEGALADAAEASQVGAEEFLAGMAEQGMDEEMVRDQLRQQVEIESLIEDEHGEFEATDEEIEEAYEQAKAQQEQMPAQPGQPPQEVPPLEELRPQLEEQVTTQKKNEATQEMADELREGADVTIHL